MLRDILKEDDPQITAIVGIIAHIQPDILVLTDIDWDYENAALSALASALSNQNLVYPYRLALQPNSGRPSSYDLHANGYLGDPRDAWGYGRFSGDGGIAVLSRFEIDFADVADLSATLWRDLPGAQLPQYPDGTPFPSAEVQLHWPLSSTAHWIVPISTPRGPVELWVWSATPPVFDGVEDANGLRNHDELRLWLAVLEGTLTDRTNHPFVLIGNANLDPKDGAGINEAMASLLANPNFNDPTPRSEGGRLAADQGHIGDPALDTADWPDNSPGNLRVSYILPDNTLQITGAGVFWPAPEHPDAALLGEDGLAAGPHRLVWVDILR